MLRPVEPDEKPEFDVRSVRGGLLVQQKDVAELGDIETKVVTKRPPTRQETAAMLFGWRVVKHVKSNAIVYAGADRTLGIGAGQMSRVDASRIAVWKAAEANLSLKGSAVASDAFFPFPGRIDRRRRSRRDGGDSAGRLGPRQRSHRRRRRARRGDGIHGRPTLPALSREREQRGRPPLMFRPGPGDDLPSSRVPLERDRENRSGLVHRFTLLPISVSRGRDDIGAYRPRHRYATACLTSRRHR